MKKISNKIVLAIMICVIISACVVGYISAQSAEKVLSEQVNHNMQSLSSKFANEMETSFAHYEGVAQTIGTYVSATFDKSKGTNLPMSAGYFQELSKYIQAVSLQNKELTSVSAFSSPHLSKAFLGSWFHGDEEVKFDPYDAYKEFVNEDEKWYWHGEVVEKKVAMWTKPYFNSTFEMECISYYYPILEEGDIIAFISVDVPFQTIKSIASDISGYDVDGVILLDSNNQVIVDRNFSEGTSLSDAGYGELERALQESSTGFITMEMANSGRCFVGYERLKNGFTVVVYNPESIVFEPINRTNLDITIVSGIVIIVAIILAFIVGRSISKPIYLVIEDLLLMETGNFTGVKHKKCLKNKDETGKLAKALEVIQISMKDMVSIVNENSSFVAELVDKLGDVVQQLMQRAVNVNEVAEELSAGMEETSATADSLSDTSFHMKQYMDEMKQKNMEGSSSTVEISKKAMEINNELREEAISVEGKTNNIVQGLHNAIEEARKVEQIKILTESILAIADETNLLALNASIEAARVGSQGKGFGVIAHEISRLAEQSQETAHRIQGIVVEVIGSVQKLSNSSEGALEFMNDYIINGYTQLLGVSEQYSNDSTKIQNLFEGYSSISNDVVREIELLTAAFYDLKNATADGTVKIQDLASNAEQMSAITQQVQKQSQVLDEVFAKLTDAIGRFSV